MKMGTIVSPWRFDATRRAAILQSNAANACGRAAISQPQARAVAVSERVYFGAARRHRP